MTRSLDHLHLQTLGSLATTGGISRERFEEFNAASNKIDTSCDEARLLLSDASITAIAEARDFAMRFMMPGEQPAWLEKARSIVKENESGELEFEKLPAKVGEGLKVERKQLEVLVRKAIGALKSEFPT